jgi:diguanylate cyclase (GGDEF)-like protein
MKRADRIKTIQLVIFSILAIICVLEVIVFDASTHIMGLLLWLSLALEFFFIFADFTIFEKLQNVYNSMIDTMRSDPVAKIANRYSVDSLIDRFDGVELTDGFCCVAFEITNIKEINAEYGRKAGNNVLRSFSIVLKMASLNKYFVGRNGGSRFIAVSEDADRADVEQLKKRIDQKLDELASTPGSPKIEYSVGLAFKNEDRDCDIVGLIALSNRRIHGKDAQL